jgi:hypothetical protein
MYQRRNKNGTTNSNNDTMYNNNDIEGGAGGHRKRGGGITNNTANSDILEQQNNERIELLSDQVSRLKGLTMDINNEVKEQNSLLDGMHDGFVNTKDMLASSLGRIGTMLESGGAKHMCYMVGFCVCAMIFLWWLMSFKGTSGA